MAQEHLNDSEVCSVLQESCSSCVAKHVRRNSSMNTTVDRQCFDKSPYTLRGQRIASLIYKHIIVWNLHSDT